MKNLIKTPSALFILVACFILASCGAKKTDDSEANEDSQQETIQSTSDALTIIPIYEVEGKNANANEGKVWSLNRFAFKKPDGSFMMFDNEGDYAKYCPYISFLENAHWQFFFGKEETVNEEAALFDKFTNGISLYKQGRKNEIQDNEILEAIEKAYYNFISKEGDNYYLSDQAYGVKEYKTDFGGYMLAYGWDKSHLQEPITKNKRIAPRDEQIPEGALIIGKHRY
ncbi:MAG: hypothetical protein NC241_03760 [Bacteroides sp.]|nr:hypothetical protein [Bacteroides sp.]MCM1456304.1 hypothetical protein [Lachnoclostridium sp.]